MTSIANVALVLDMNNDITKSWLDKGKPKSSLEKTLENNSTDTRSQKNVKETKTPESTTVPPVSTKKESKKEGGLFEEGPKKETKKDSSGLFEEGPIDPYDYTYRTEIEGIGISEEDWNKMSKKEKQYHLDCNGI
jgi:hypothetical protein